MPTILQAFRSSTLPASFTRNGPVNLQRMFSWGGADIVPQTSDFIALIDSPRHDGAGVPVPNTGRFDTRNCSVEHGKDKFGVSFCTYGHEGGDLLWDVAITKAPALIQFDYVFLGGQITAPFNGFAQFQLVNPDGTVFRKKTLAQSRPPKTPALNNKKRYRWQPGQFDLDQPFTGKLRWVVTTGETRQLGDTNAGAKAGNFPSCLAIDFISIKT